MANRQRNHAKEQFWRRTMARCRASGLSIRAFCEREGLLEPSFYQWRRELARRDRQTIRPGRRGMAFVPVRVVGDEGKAPGCGAIEIVLARGRIVRVSAGFEGETLAQVVAVLEGNPC